jgi:hypothetical protein
LEALNQIALGFQIIFDNKDTHYLSQLCVNRKERRA